MSDKIITPLEAQIDIGNFIFAKTRAFKKTCLSTGKKMAIHNETIGEILGVQVSIQMLYVAPSSMVE